MVGLLEVVGVGVLVGVVVGALVGAGLVVGVGVFTTFLIVGVGSSSGSSVGVGVFSIFWVGVGVRVPLSSDGFLVETNEKTEMPSVRRANPKTRRIGNLFC